MPDLLATAEATWPTSDAGGTAGSQDPNEKLRVSGFGDGNHVKADTSLTYRIDFENYKTATAPAQVVTIRDALSDRLDWTTFELAEIGFGDVVVPVPAGEQYFQTVVGYADDEYDLEVEVHIEAWLDGGTFYANFLSIDPDTGLPPAVDIGFMMPETDPETGRGQGYVSYLIRPKPGLASGTEVRNIATIQFDFSLEIDTNQVDPLDKTKGTDPEKEALVTFDALPPSSSVNALPAASAADFTVSWSGADDEHGSGIRGYDVYVREDGDAWQAWLTDTPDASDSFTGQDGRTYAFHAVATDNVGHREVKTPQAEASTQVGDQRFIYLPLVMRQVE